jgi:hypothetical protein
MPASPSALPADRPPARQLALWTVFGAVLVAGLVLYARFGTRVAPLLEKLREP